MDIEQLTSLWMQNPTFATAGEPVCQELAQTHPPTVHAPGSVLVREGDIPTHLFVVLQGTIRIYQRAADGREVLVKLLRAPSVFCDLELLAGLPMVKNVAAVDEVQLAAIDGREFVELLRRFPEAMLQHLQQVSAAFCVAARNQRQVFASVEQRLANLLLSYLDFYGRPVGQSVQITEPLSQQQMAQSLGAVRRSVAKVLSEWTRANIIGRENDLLLIHQLDKLEDLAAPIRGSLCYQMGMSLTQLTHSEELSQGELELTSGLGKLVGQRFAVQGELMIGTHPRCDLVLPDEAVSRHHCRVFRGATGPRFWIEDLDSDGGTRLNGRPVRRGVLRDEDQIELGSTRLVFHLV